MDTTTRQKDATGLDPPWIEEPALDVCSLCMLLATQQGRLQCTYNVTLRRVYATFVAVEKQ